MAERVPTMAELTKLAQRVWPKAGVRVALAWGQIMLLVETPRAPYERLALYPASRVGRIALAAALRALAKEKA